MEKLFVPHHLAKLAKEKGFNEPCLGFYYPTINDKEICQIKTSNDFESKTNSDLSSHTYISSPLYQQLIDWFREKHGIIIYILRQKDMPFLAFTGFIEKVNDITYSQECCTGGYYYGVLYNCFINSFKLI